MNFIREIYHSVFFLSATMAWFMVLAMSIALLNHGFYFLAFPSLVTLVALYVLAFKVITGEFPEQPQFELIHNFTETVKDFIERHKPLFIFASMLVMLSVITASLLDLLSLLASL